MTIQQVIDLARRGTLKNLPIKEDTEDNVDTIIGYINLGMIELYSRFPIKSDEAIITLVDGKEIYTLDGTDTNVSMPTDSDFMWLIAAYDEVPENSDLPVVTIPINEEDNLLSINTVSWNKIQVPITVNGAYISLIYATAPKFLTSDDVAETIDLPPQMINALLLYLGYMGHESMNAEINAENNTFLMRFETAIKKITDLGLFTSDDVSMKTKFKAGNWA